MGSMAITNSPERLCRLFDRKRQKKTKNRVTKQVFANTVARKAGLRSLTGEAVTQWCRRKRRPSEELRPVIHEAAVEHFGVAIPVSGWPRIRAGAL